MSYNIPPIGAYPPPPPVDFNRRPGAPETDGSVAEKPKNIFETAGSQGRKPKNIFEDSKVPQETAGQIAAGMGGRLNIAA